MIRLGSLSAALVVAVLSTTTVVPAHTRSQSVSQWTIDGREAAVVLRVRVLELTRLAGAEVGTRPLEAWLGEYATGRLVLLASGVRCAVSRPPEILRPDDDRVAVAWRVRCPDTPEVIETSFLLGPAPGHLHFAQVRRHAGRAERVLSAAEPRWQLAATGEASADGGVAQYVWLGVGHIATGLDHLAFLLALLLVGRSGREAVIVVSGFTVGHSVTLGVAALGWLQPAAPAVEALIGLSIVLVACEGAAAGGWGVAWAAVLAVLAGMRMLGVGVVPATSLAGLALFAVCHFALLDAAASPARVRASVALLFGLVHGLGFGGFLLDVGLPPTRIVAALLGFNVGVELGQVALVALAWPVLRRLGDGVARDLGLASVAGLGCYWFVLRAYG